MSTDYTDQISLAKVKPSETIAMAAFHIRRLASISIRADPSRISEVLRCRQWSSASSAINTFGGAPYLDGAVLCVAAKLRQITFGKISPFFVLFHYDRALHSLRDALQAPRSTENEADLLSAVQLLAMYEMLDGPENEAWSKHITGAHDMIYRCLENQLRPMLIEDRPIARNAVAPMYADALLDNDGDFFVTYPWQGVIQATVIEQYCQLRYVEALLACFLELPDLLRDAGLCVSRDGNLEARLEILSRAQDLKARLRTVLLSREFYLHARGQAVPSFDILGLGLASIITLDRIIAAIMPRNARTDGSLSALTRDMCTHILESELEMPNVDRLKKLLLTLQY